MTEIQVRDEGRCLVIRGDMTHQEVPGLLKAIAPLNRVTHVDLADVGRVDSSALTVLLACSRAAHGTTVRVHHASPALRALNDLYGLQTLFWVV